MTTSLKAISALVKDKIKAARKTTYTDIANQIIREFASEADPASIVTLKRRIYDVITVLSVLGYIEKIDRRIEWVGQSDVPFLRNSEIMRRRMRVESKRQNFRYKAKLLLLYKSLIEMRKPTAKPAKALSLPTVIVRATDNEHLATKRQRGDSGRQELVITSEKGVPYTFSPLDILNRMSFPDEIVRRVYDATPELSSMLGGDEDEE